MDGQSKSLSRRLIPYWLMGPGLLWLVLFFVIPLYFMARLSLESGTLETGFSFSWEWSNFSDAFSRYDTQFYPLVHLRRHRHADRSA